MGATVDAHSLLIFEPAKIPNYSQVYSRFVLALLFELLALKLCNSPASIDVMPNKWTDIKFIKTVKKHATTAEKSTSEKLADPADRCN